MFFLLHDPQFVNTVRDKGLKGGLSEICVSSKFRFKKMLLRNKTPSEHRRVDTVPKDKKRTREGRGTENAVSARVGGCGVNTDQGTPSQLSGRPRARGFIKTPPGK